MTLTQRDLQVALRCASEVLDMRRLRGAPIPKWMSEHAHRIKAEYLTSHLSAGGHEIDCPDSELGQQRIGTIEAAARLGMTTRNVRRKHADLDGRKEVGGAWTFDGEAFVRYAQERQRN